MCGPDTQSCDACHANHALMPVPMQVIADAIFGGCGYVPDVTSLQAWLECAWAAGYDPMGAEQLGGCAS